MRTTIEFDADTAKAVDDLRRELGVGVSEAVNMLIRRGLLPRHNVPAFQQATRDLGLKIDVSNISVALEDLDGVHSR